MKAPFQQKKQNEVKEKLEYLWEENCKYRQPVVKNRSYSGNLSDVIEEQQGSCVV